MKVIPRSQMRKCSHKEIVINVSNAIDKSNKKRIENQMWQYRFLDDLDKVNVHGELGPWKS